MDDIRRLYSSLIHRSEDSLDHYLEATYFEWDIMDEKEKAEKILKKGLEKVMEKTGELEKLMESIKNEY